LPVLASGSRRSIPTAARAVWWVGRKSTRYCRPSRTARAEGLEVYGPIPADTFFVTVRQPGYDVYVSMYHDQGRIAIKLLDFGKVVTVAEGLPIIFCTVGHGTAFDIVGKGVAIEENMKEAILLAARQAVLRRTGAGRA